MACEETTACYACAYVRTVEARIASFRGSMHLPSDYLAGGERILLLSWVLGGGATIVLSWWRVVLCAARGRAAVSVGLFCRRLVLLRAAVRLLINVPCELCHL